MHANIELNLTPWLSKQNKIASTTTVWKGASCWSCEGQLIYFQINHKKKKWTVAWRHTYWHSYIFTIWYPVNYGSFIYILFSCSDQLLCVVVLAMLKQIFVSDTWIDFYISSQIWIWWQVLLFFFSIIFVSLI